MKRVSCGDWKLMERLKIYETIEGCEGRISRFVKSALLCNSEA